MINIISRSPVLKVRDFRLLLASTFFENMTRGENVVLGWVVLELTDSPFMVGVAMAIRHAPGFFLGIPGGAIADLVDRRRLMRVLIALFATVSLIMGLLLVSGKAQLWQLLIIPAAAGTVHMMLNTTRQSLVFDLVAHRDALNGMSYIGLAMRSGGLVGALTVGFALSAWGAGAGYFVITGGCCISFVIMGLIHSRGQDAPTGTGTGNISTGLWEFWKELTHNHTVAVLVVIVMLVELCGFTPNVLMPSIARDVWNLGPGGLGILNAFSSAGGIVAIALISFVGKIRYQGIAFIVVMHVFGVAIIILGFSPSIYIAVCAIVVMSGMMALSDLFSQTLMQRLVPNDLRGRIMGAWATAIGIAPLGNLEIGALASLLGITMALVFHGGALILLAVATLATFGKLRRI